jgi:hypothetical protein
MTQFDFPLLYTHYPAIDEKMPETFSSHQFILKLAQTQQTLYVEALYAYRYNTHRGQPAPFRAVHSEIARGLSQSDLVEHIGEDDSVDIFGQPNRCAFWRKV